MARFRNQGTILSVATTQVGCQFDDNEPIGETEVLVVAPYEFNEDGGQAYIPALEDQIVTYTGWDSETNYLHLSTPLNGNVTTEDNIYAYPPAYEQTAYVHTNDSDETIPARVPFTMQALLPDGIRDTDTGFEQVAVESDGYGWVVSEIYGKQPVLDGTKIDTLPDELMSDGIPPVISPGVTVVPLGVGALRGFWVPVPQPNLRDPIIYDVYVSATSPVVADADHFLMSTAGTSAAFAEVSDGAGGKIPISRTVPSYMAVWARDTDGLAPALGLEGSGTPVKADLDQLNVEQLNANTIETLELWASSVTADFVFANNRIIVGNENASHIKIDPAVGLILYAADGLTPVVTLDMTPAQLSEFTGKINTDQLAVFDSLEISGILSFIMSEALLTIASSTINPPSSAPTLAQGVNTRAWPIPPTGFTETGLYWNGTNWERTIYHSGTFETRIQTIDSNANVTASVTLVNESADRDARGLGYDGSDYYVIRRDNAAAGSGVFYLKKYNADGTPVPDTGAAATLGYAATYGSYFPVASRGADTVVVDGSNVVHVLDANIDRIRRFSTTGVYAGYTSIPTALSVVGMDVDASGNYYLASFDEKVTKIDSSGNVLFQFGSSGTGNGQFTGIKGIRLDGSGNIWTTETGNHRVQKFNSSGVYQSQFGSLGTGNGQFDYPIALEFDGSGNIYVSDYNNHRVQKFDSSGTYLSQFGGAGSGNGQFFNPRDIAIDSSGNIFVVDNQNYRIQKFNSSHVFQVEFGAFDDEDDGPRYISVDSSGNVYITTDDNNDVWKYTNAGVHGTDFSTSGGVVGGDGSFDAPYRIATDSSGNIWIVDNLAHVVKKYNSSGVWQADYGSHGTGDNQFINPSGIAIDSSNNIYITDSSNVRKFDSSMTFVTRWGGQGSGNGQFLFPEGIAVDSSSGHVYVADDGNSRVQKFTTSGTYVTKWGTAGTANGQFQSVYGIAVDASGNVYVTDIVEDRVQKFNSSGTYQSKFGTYGSGNGQFQSPYDIEIFGGNIYVADNYGTRVQKFNSSHTYQTSIGSEGSGNGQFTPGGLVALTFDSSGNMYTVEQNNPFYGGTARIQKWTAAYPQLSEPVADEVSPTIRTQPTCGWDGTNVLVGGADGNSTQLRNTTSAGVILHDPTTLDYAGRYTTSTVVDNVTTTFIGINNFDYGASRVVIATPTTVKVYTYSGTTLTAASSFPTWTLDGTVKATGWDGTNFFSGADTNVLKKYSTFLSTSAGESKFWSQYQWEDGGGLGTTPGPKASLTVSDRRWLNVTVPVPGPGTTVTRVFLGNGTTTPANSAMYSRGTTSISTTLQFSSAVYSGTNPKTVSDLAAGQPGKLKAQAGSFTVDGDSKGAWHEKQATPRFLGELSSDTSVSNSTETTITWVSNATHSHASAGYWTHSGTDLTVNKTGFWDLNAAARWSPDVDGFRETKIFVNGTQVMEGAIPGGSTSTSVPADVCLFLTSGDVIQIRVEHTAGASLTLRGNSGDGVLDTYFQAIYDGPKT